jgi:hypothetical protein
MKIFSPILKGTTTVSQGTTNLSGSFTGSLLGTAATASYADNFTVGGTLTAQTINVQIITSSIEFNTGSTRNGALSSNTHQFTGSVLMSGSVGIGTSTPTDKFEIQDGYLATYHSVNLNTAGYGINFYTNGGGAKNTIASIYPSQVGTARSGDLLFLTSNSGAPAERMRITSSGSVGINNSSINSNYYLDVNGLIATTSDSAGAGISRGGIIFKYSTSNVGSRTWIISNDTNTWGDLAIRVSTTQTTSSYNNVISIKSNGFVGIGIADPLYLLHIPQGNNLYLSNLYLYGSANNPALSSGATGGSMAFEGGGAGEGKIYLQGAASGGNGYIQLSAGGSLRMTIASNGSIGAPSGTNIYNPSDIRLKQNISTTTYGLDTISLLNPIKFNWVDGFESSEDGKDMLGFVAQEVLEVIPEAVESFGGDINLNGEVISNPLRVNEKFIIPVLVKAIQELKSENDTLKEILQRNNIQ